MKIAVIGGGITGLTAAYDLSQSGHTVTVFEKSPILGGLAHGFTGDHWEWPLEFAYHHFFTNDEALITLLHELGMERDMIIKRPITATLLPKILVESQSFDFAQDSKLKVDRNKTSSHVPKLESQISNLDIMQLDSPLSLLKFSRLSLFDRLRTGAMLAFAKVNPFWQPLENLTAETFIKTLAGYASWKTIWEPLLVGKFANYAPKIAASWFWARIAKRTTNLGYIKGGFQTFVNRLAESAVKNGVTISILTDIQSIQQKQNGDLSVISSPGKIWTNKSKPASPNLKSRNSQLDLFDKILLTVPSPVATQLVNFPKEYAKKLQSIPHLWAQILVLETNQPILNDIYWLNINDRAFPFLAAVAHTNYMDKNHYANHHITYFGNYLPDGHPYLSMDKEQLIKIFRPYIERLISDQCRKNQLLKVKSNKESSIKKSNLESQISNLEIANTFLFTAPHAQPVHELRYSKRAPTLETPIPNLYLANLDSIYPWDRGTNYAVELGRKAAKTIGMLQE